MIIEMRNGKTLIIKPESTAEVVALQGFEGGKVSIEKPEPFAANIPTIKIEKAE